MRYLVLTDIHANLEALTTCVEAARARGFDATLVLGDIVGYGADPNAVIDCVRALEPSAIVRGNHDKVASGIEQPEGFNAVARSAVTWTQDTLDDDRRAWLAGLPEGPHVVDGVVEICHGSPFDEDAYILDELDVMRAFKTAGRQLCLFGHTHYQITFSLADGEEVQNGLEVKVDRRFELRQRTKYLVNPGAVGQPRDGDPRAAYGIVDSAARRVELFRVPYPVDRAQAKVLRAGLPEVLATRLAVGR